MALIRKISLVLAVNVILLVWRAREKAEEARKVMVLIGRDMQHRKNTYRCEPATFHCGQVEMRVKPEVKIQLYYQEAV